MVRKAALKTVTMVLASVCATPAYAGAATMADVMGACGQAKGSFAEGLCFGFINGVVQRDQEARVIGHDAIICRIDGDSNGEVVNAVKAYYKAHPETAKIPAATVIAVAVRDTFCTK